MDSLTSPQSMLRLLLAASLFLFFQTASATDWTRTVKNFHFENAEVVEVVSAMSRLTGKNFVVAPGLVGRVTIIQSEDMTLGRAFQAFVTAMASNGYRVINYGSHYKVARAR